MRSANTSNASTPLCHFPFPDSPDYKMNPDPLMDVSKTDEGYMSHSGFHSNFSPSPHHSYMNHSVQYPRTPQSHYRPITPMTTTGIPPPYPSGPYNYAQGTPDMKKSYEEHEQQRFSSGTESTEEGNESEESWHEEMKLKAPKKRMTQRKVKIEEDEMKPARKYTQKSQSIKNTAEYKAKREHNNLAVRKSRAKAAVLRAKQDEESKKLVTENLRLKNAMDVLTEEVNERDRLICRVREELQRCDDPDLFNQYPTLSQLILHQSYSG